MPPPKKKTTTLSLSELQHILKEQSGGTEGISTKTSWAEDEFELPSARNTLNIINLFLIIFSLVYAG